MAWQTKQKELSNRGAMSRITKHFDQCTRHASAREVNGQGEPHCDPKINESEREREKHRAAKKRRKKSGQNPN